MSSGAANESESCVWPWPWSPASGKAHCRPPRRTQGRFLPFHGRGRPDARRRAAAAAAALRWVRLACATRFRPFRRRDASGVLRSTLPLSPALFCPRLASGVSECVAKSPASPRHSRLRTALLTALPTHGEWVQPYLPLTLPESQLALASRPVPASSPRGNERGQRRPRLPVPNLLPSQANTSAAVARLRDSLCTDGGALHYRPASAPVVQCGPFCNPVRASESDEQSQCSTALSLSQPRLRPWPQSVPKWLKIRPLSEPELALPLVSPSSVP